MVVRRTHRFSVTEYHRMIEMGLLTREHRVELIRGEIVDKMATGEDHTFVVIQLGDLLIPALGGKVVFSTQNPVVLADSEPEPDLAILQRRADRYRGHKPQANAVLLLIEVADSSLETDRLDKAPLYAENGIVEYWIINLIDRQIEVFREPANGTYLNTFIRRSGEQIELLAFPDVVLAVDDLLP